MLVGDFNGDGTTDLAITGPFASNSIHQVSVLLGNGTGGFTLASTFLGSSVAANGSQGGSVMLAAIAPGLFSANQTGNGVAATQLVTNLVQRQVEPDVALFASIGAHEHQSSTADRTRSVTSAAVASQSNGTEMSVSG